MKRKRSHSFRAICACMVVSLLTVAYASGCSQRAPIVVPGGSSSDGGQSGATDSNFFTFRDVHGKQYEVILNPNVERHSYDPQKWVHDGYKVSYEDDEYKSRLGVDVSRYQGDIDWQAVKDDGYEFAFIRAGFRGYGAEGNLKEDPMFRQNIEGAQAAGLDVGVYFFAQAVNEEEAVEEADFVLSLIDDYKLQLPVVYDPESVSSEDARTRDVTGEQFTRNTAAFCRRMEKAGYDTAVYANMVWEATKLDLSALSDIPIWYADYESVPQTPYRFTWWQYSDTAQVSGIDGYCDVDVELIKKKKWLFF